MALFSNRVQGVHPSQTKAMTQRAAELRVAGRDIIVLSLGEPDFDTPEHIRTAGITAINTGHTRYTAVSGVKDLKQAIANKLQRDNNLIYTPDEIIVCGGAKQVLSNAFMATLNERDEVVFPAPCWTSYPDMVRIAGGTPVAIDCTETGFKLTPEILEKAVNEKTRWLLLNSPCNPTGVVYCRKELQALAEVVRQYPNLWVMADDIYEHLIYTDGAFATMAELDSEMKERTLTINGVSKAYAMTGWRIGYGAGPSALIKVMTLLQSQMTSHPCSVSQQAAIEALNGDKTHLRTFVNAFRERRDLVLGKIKDIPGLCCNDEPAGAFYLFPSCADAIGARTPAGSMINNDMDFSNYLLEFANVATTPGMAFMASPYIRISYASSLEDLTEACARIATACENLVFVNSTEELVP